MKTNFSVCYSAATIGHFYSITLAFFNSSASLNYVQLQIFGLEILVNAETSFLRYIFLFWGLNIQCTTVQLECISNIYFSTEPCFHAEPPIIPFLIHQAFYLLLLLSPWVAKKIFLSNKNKIGLIFSFISLGNRDLQ